MSELYDELDSLKELLRKFFVLVDDNHIYTYLKDNPKGRDQDIIDENKRLFEESESELDRLAKQIGYTLYRINSYGKISLKIDISREISLQDEDYFKGVF